MRNTENPARARIGNRAAMILILAAIAVLFVLFLKDNVIPLIKLELNNDINGAHQLLADRGVQGALSVILIEALQMVVVFIPAEFIQISSGLSYPLHISVLLCDLSRRDHHLSARALLPGRKRRL